MKKKDKIMTITIGFDNGGHPLYEAEWFKDVDKDVLGLIDSSMLFWLSQLKTKDEPSESFWIILNDLSETFIKHKGYILNNGVSENLIAHFIRIVKTFNLGHFGFDGSVNFPKYNKKDIQKEIYKS